MSKGIESIKPLDANIEKKNLEGTYKNKTNEQEPKLDSWDLAEQTRKKDAERKSAEKFARATGGRFGGYSGIGFPSMPKPKFSAIDIGKATINTPTQEKKEAQKVESELEAMRESSLDELDK